MQVSLNLILMLVLNPNPLPPRTCSSRAPLLPHLRAVAARPACPCPRPRSSNRPRVPSEKSEIEWGTVGRLNNVHGLLRGEYDMVIVWAGRNTTVRDTVDE